MRCSRSERWGSVWAIVRMFLPCVAHTRPGSAQIQPTSSHIRLRPNWAKLEHHRATFGRSWPNYVELGCHISGTPAGFGLLVSRIAGSERLHKRDGYGKVRSQQQAASGLKHLPASCGCACGGRSAFRLTTMERRQIRFQGSAWGVSSGSPRWRSGCRGETAPKFGGLGLGSEIGARAPEVDEFRGRRDVL